MRPKISQQFVNTSNYNLSVIFMRIRRPVFVLGLLAFLLLADVAVKTVELSRLISRIEVSESIMKEVYERESRIDNIYYVGGSWTNFDSAESAYAAIARDLAPELSSEVAAVRKISILPWHKSINYLKAEYLDHGDAWIDSLNFKTNSTDNLLWSQELSQNVSNTFSIFCSTSEAAVPLIDAMNFKKRLNEICKD